MSLNTMYDVSLQQAINIIRLGGHKNTVLLQGHIGTGKSSALKVLAEMFPKHRPVYFDCTTKDLGDIMIPRIKDATALGGACAQFVPHEELGLHIDGPIILMIDEYGKANPAVKNAMLRTMLEREMGSYKLHPDSIIFATTNLGAEGVGDLLPAHARNRLTVVKMRKPTNVEWIEDFALNAGVDHTMLAWVQDNPQVFATFEDIKDPQDNKFIFHPADPSRVSFVTPRSLEKASNWLKIRDRLTDKVLMAALMGTVGSEAAANLNTYVRVADQLPSLDSIKKDPMGAVVPSSASAVCMVVHRTLQTIDKTWMDAWMDYASRLDKEAQTMFAMQVRRPNYNKQAEVVTNKKFTAWCMANNYVFAADKK